MSSRLAASTLCLMTIVLGSFVFHPVQAADKWGPFRGRIVDVETGEPIAGAAILVVWYEAVSTPVHTNRKFYDARETTSDADGRFEVPRRPPPFFEFQVFPPDIMIFVPGYVEQSESVTPPNGQPFVDPTEIGMRKLKTREELWAKRRGRPTRVPDEKMPGFLKAIEAEYGMLYPGSVSPSPRRQP